MAGLEKKWEELWKNFEATRKSEWLKAKEVGKFNAMIKEVPAMKATLKSLDAGEIDLLNACGNIHGKKTEMRLYFSSPGSPRCRS